MAFDWRETIRAVAPTIGTALGGPFAGMATKFVADKLLGKSDATIEDIEAFVGSASPETLLELKKLDLQFKTSVRELGIKEFQLEVQDRDSARNMFAKDIRPQVALSALFILGYFALLYVLLAFDTLNVKESLMGLFMGLVGVITGEIPRIMSFWFGSSMGSKEKNYTINEMKKG